MTSAHPPGEPHAPFPSTLILRDGTAADAATVAALHAASWRSAYRGVAADRYLDGPIEAERRTFWAERLATARPGRVLVLAERGDTPVGFVYALTAEEPHGRTLVDNLHVAASDRGTGLGRRLMHAMAARLHETLATAPVYLFVLEANTAARNFYDRIGGTLEGHERHALPDGTGIAHPVLRYAWPSPLRLMAATREGAP